MNQPKPKIRLYVPEPYAPGQSLLLGTEQSHYIANVMRCMAGHLIGIFNGSDGEWLAEVSGVEKRSIVLKIKHQLCAQKNSPDLWLAFAPIKNKTELVVEKAVELGASAVLPVVTRHAVVRSINKQKLAAHAIEAAEQSGRHDLPSIVDFPDLSLFLSKWPKDRTLLYADESGSGQALKTLLPSLPQGKYGVLIGPEGGFAADERRMLGAFAHVKAFGMGPRILRADTAATAAMACLQAWLGDWEEKPHFTAAP